MSDVLYIEDFQYLLSSGKKRVRSICPFCNERRSNKKDKCLSIDTESGAYYCHYCNAKGYFKSKLDETLSKDRKLYKPKKMNFVKPKAKNKEMEQVFADPFLQYFQERGISKETLIKARVTQETEFMPQVGRKIGCMAFNYYLDGELINIKHRTRNKDFKLVSGAKLIPYNIDSIAPDAYESDEEKYCLYVEGEIDALTYIECGFEHVVSVPNGASTNLEYLDDFIDSHFDKLDCIYISVDNDKKGIECRNELIRRFGSEMCKLVEYPKPCKDINEVLVQYGRSAVEDCVRNAKDCKPDGIQELVDVEAALDDIFEHGFEKGATFGIPSLDDIFSVKTGLLHIVTGVPSHGKSFMLNYLLIRLNLLHDWKVAFFSPEFYPVSHHIAQTIETYGGQRFCKENYTIPVYEKMKDYLARNMFYIDPNDTDINSVMERAKYLIRKKGIKVLVIDPFNALTDKERKNQKQDEYISEFLQKLRWFCRKYDVAGFIIMHPTKLQKLENGQYPVCDLYNCKGASEINDKADVGITVWRNKEEDYAELHITKMKFRNLGKNGHATFKFNINNGRYVEIGDADDLRARGVSIPTMEVVWDNSNYILKKLQTANSKEMFDDTHVQETDTSEMFTTISEVPF
jgi:twinkle protein